MSGKIINTFQQRRELQKQIVELQDTKSESEMLQKVRSIAQEYPHEMVLAVLVRSLDTSNSQLRGALAHLATLLPPDESIPLLQNTVADRQNSTQARLNAVTILERFLGEEVSPGLLGDLVNTDEIAFQSLCEAVEEGRNERHILLEYVTQMKEEDVEVAYIVMDQLSRLAETDRLELLRLMAQDDRPPVARSALACLEDLNPNEAGSRLVQIMHTLQFVLPPDMAKRAERASRKYRFNGMGYRPTDSGQWRALIAPSEANGNQTIWFFEHRAGTKNFSPFLSMVINKTAGILQTYGSDRMPLEDLPGSKEVGELMTLTVDGDASMIFLEAPFDYGRWLVQEASKSHWAGSATQPLFGEYVLYNDLLWQFEAPKLEPSLITYFSDGADADAEALVDMDELDACSVELLHHPSMGGWVLHSHLLWNTIRSGFQVRDSQSIDEFTQLVVKEILLWSEHELFVQGLVTGLQTQAAWLHLAGMERAATLAHRLAGSFSAFEPAQNPFLFRYIRQAIQRNG